MSWKLESYIAAQTWKGYIMFSILNAVIKTSSSFLNSMKLLKQKTQHSLLNEWDDRSGNRIIIIWVRVKKNNNPRAKEHLCRYAAITATDNIHKAQKYAWIIISLRQHPAKSMPRFSFQFVYHPHHPHHHLRLWLFCSVCRLQKILVSCHFQVATLLHGLIWVPLVNGENNHRKVRLRRRCRALDSGFSRGYREESQTLLVVFFFPGFQCRLTIW